MKKLLLSGIIILFISCESKKQSKIRIYNDSLVSLRDSIEPLFLKSADKHSEYISKAYELMFLDDFEKAEKYADSAKLESDKVNSFYNKMYP